MIRQDVHSLEDIAQNIIYTLESTIDATKSYKGAHVLMRAIPKLQSIRLESHNTTAELTAINNIPIKDNNHLKALITRSFLAIEMVYATIEMLFETDFKDHDVVIERASVATSALYGNVI